MHRKERKQRISRIVAIILALIFIVLAQRGFIFAKTYNTIPELPVEETNFFEGELPDFTIDDLKYEEMDLEDYKSYDRFVYEGLGINPDNPEKPVPVEGLSEEDLKESVKKRIDHMLGTYEKLLFNYSVLKLEYSKDVTNEEVQKKITKLNDLNNEYFNTIVRLFQDIQKNPAYKDYFKELIGPENFSDLSETTLYTDKQKEISNKISTLEQKYDSLDSQAYKQKEDLYIQIVNLYNQFAKEDDYDNYYDYYQDNNDGRDYTDEELNNYYQAIKDYIAPIYMYLGLELSVSAMPNFNYPIGEDAKSIVSKTIGNISSELKEAFDYLDEANLLVEGKSSTNENVSYTMNIPQYNSAVIFLKSYNDFHDLGTLTHEFGHFNTAIREDGYSLFIPNNIDLAEIHSQGLEILYLPYSEIIYGPENARIISKLKIQDMLWAVLTGALMNEFEHYAYTTADLSPEKLEQKFAELAAEYKLDLEPTYFTDVAHIYVSPLYYLSYSVSAMAALSELETMQKDYRAAVNKYLKLASLGEEQPFKETLKAAGYKDIFSAEAISDISDAISDYLDHAKFFSVEDFEPEETESTENNEEDEEEDKPYREILPEYGDNKEKEEELILTPEDYLEAIFKGKAEDKLAYLKDALRYIFSDEMRKDLFKTMFYQLQ